MSTQKIIFLILLVILISYILYRTFKKKKYDINSFKSEWRNILHRDVDYYSNLILAEKERFELAILVFFDNVSIIGVDTKINDTDKILVAASAVIPLFGLPGSSLTNISEVLIYKNRFDKDYGTEGNNADRNILGMVGEGNMNRIMILSQPALHNGYNKKHSSHNVGIHEFVHLIDKADGKTDGLPKFALEKEEIQNWLSLVRSEIQSILAGESEINPYGATSEIEFLSVVSEYFFMQPKKLKENHAELYDKLKQIFRQDPANGLGSLG